MSTCVRDDVLEENSHPYPEAGGTPEDQALEDAWALFEEEESCDGHS